MIKELFAVGVLCQSDEQNWNKVYEQLVPSMFYCEVSAAMKERIMNVVHEMLEEYTAMYNQ